MTDFEADLLPPWLREQIARAVARLDQLPPNLRASLAQPTTARQSSLSRQAERTMADRKATALLWKMIGHLLDTGAVAAINDSPCPTCGATFGYACTDGDDYSMHPDREMGDIQLPITLSRMADFAREVSDEMLSVISSEANDRSGK